MLELAGITAGYGQQVVLRDVSLVVPDRAVVALLGPNGAGKTTLLRVASGLLRPERGRVLVDGADATGAPAHRLAALGVCHVPEGRGIYPTLSVRDNLRLQAPASMDASAASVAAERFPRLGERLTQRAGTLSGGEQQMLAMARAYLASPAVLLLDEVSLGLAPKVVDEIFQHLRLLAGQGVAMLLVEQYVTRALELADYVYILNRGRVRFAGEPRELGEAQVLASYLGEEGVA
jgi:branched-chain amino acid transport system ATP-binding protein